MITRRTLFLFSPVLLALTVTLTGTALHGFSGVDIYFHLDIAEQFALGNPVGAFDVAYSVDHTFYPPLFHLLLVSGFWLGNGELWALILQVSFLPLAVASFMFLVRKLHGDGAAFYGGLLLLGSMAYLDRVIQAQPHAIDLLLLPVAFYFCLNRKGRGWLVSSVLMVWNHGLVSIAALGGTLLAQLKRRNWRVFTAWVLLCLPVLALSLYFLVSGLRGYGGAVDTDQEYLFWHDPLFIPQYLGFLTLGFVVAAYFIYRYCKGYPVNAVVKLAVLTILSTAVMVPMWADRWLQYSTIPLALLIIEHATATTNTRLKYLYKLGIVFFAVYTVGGLLF